MIEIQRRYRISSKQVVQQIWRVEIAGWHFATQWFVSIVILGDSTDIRQHNTAPDVPLAHGYTNGCILLAIAAFNRPYMAEKHQKLIDRLPQMYKDIGCTGRFADGECSAAHADLFVNASKDHPFRKNNIRESTDEDCFDLLRKSGAVVAAA